MCENEANRGSAAIRAHRVTLEWTKSRSLNWAPPSNVQTSERPNVRTSNVTTSNVRMSNVTTSNVRTSNVTTSHVRTSKVVDGAATLATGDGGRAWSGEAPLYRRHRKRSANINTRYSAARSHCRAVYAVHGDNAPQFAARHAANAPKPPQACPAQRYVYKNSASRRCWAGGRPRATFRHLQRQRSVPGILCTMLRVVVCLSQSVSCLLRVSARLSLRGRLRHLGDLGARAFGGRRLLWLGILGGTLQLGGRGVLRFGGLRSLCLRLVPGAVGGSVRSGGFGGRGGRRRHRRRVVGARLWGKMDRRLGDGAAGFIGDGCWSSFSNRGVRKATEVCYNEQVDG